MIRQHAKPVPKAAICKGDLAAVSVLGAATGGLWHLTHNGVNRIVMGQFGP